MCHLLLYRRKKKTPFEALTLVDGKLFSIYPYDKEEIFSLTDVEMTPRSDVNIKEKRKYMEEKVLNYYGDFLEDFEYVSFKESEKIKYYNMTDNRVPLIDREDNYIKIFTGKIQGIFLIEDYLKNI